MFSQGRSRLVSKRFLRKVPGNVAESTLGASSVLLSFLLGISDR